MKEPRRRFLSLFSVVVLLSCGALTNAQQNYPPPDGANANSASSAASRNTDHPAAGERNPRYKICRDDILVLTFLLSPELNQKVIVQPDGFITLQTAGSLHVEGLTVAGIGEAVKKAYAGILHDPIIDVDLADFQKPFFTVLGQVGKPGQYDLRYDITVTQAIAVAGGFSPTAKTQVFLYRSISSNWAEVHELKVKDILQGKNISEDAHLHPGDMIFVPEKAITKLTTYVPYSIGTSVSPYPSAYY